jgi:hypothetical protein
MSIDPGFWLGYSLWIYHSSREYCTAIHILL